LKYITYSQSGGRSGHALKDIASAIILSLFDKNLELCYHKSWNNQKICKNFNIKNYKDIKYKKEHIIQIRGKAWDGMQYSRLQSILNEIDALPDETMIKIKGVARIHPNQLHNWYHEGLIREDLFTNKFIPILKNFYNAVKKDPINQISIHIRRGDIAKAMIESGWDLAFYKNIINKLQKKYPKKPIKIFVQNQGSEDLKDLYKIKNVFINSPKGYFCHETLSQDIDEMVNSEIFIPSNCGLATWICYLSDQKIILPEKVVDWKDKKILNIKHFYHKVLPENFSLIF